MRKIIRANDNVGFGLKKIYYFAPVIFIIPIAGAEATTPQPRFNQPIPCT